MNMTEESRKTKITFEICKQKFEKKIFPVRELTLDTTLAELVLYAMIYKKEEIEKFSLWCSLLDILEELLSIKVIDSYKINLIEIFSSVNNSKIFRKKFLKYFMKYAKEKNIWHTSFSISNSKTKFYLNRVKLINYIPNKNNDSIFYTLSNLYIKDFNFNNTNLNTPLKLLDKYIDKKWSELNQTDYNEIKEIINKQESYIRLFKYMIQNSTLEEKVKDFILDKKHVDFINDKIFLCDLWFFIDTESIRKTNTSIDFSFLDHDKKGKEALKLYLRYKINNKGKGCRSLFSTIKNTLFFYLKKENIKLYQFKSSDKNRFIDWLNLEVTKKFTRNTVYGFYKNAKGFLSYLINVYPEFVNTNLSLKGRTFIKEPQNKKAIYEDHEIEKIELALSLYDKNEWFVDLVVIIMLTGKRIGEVLELRFDCLKQIDKFYYLEYIDSKSGFLKTLPLSSDEHSLVKDDLFKTNIYDILKEITDRRLKNRPICTLEGMKIKEDENKLFYIEYNSTNNFGIKFSRVSESLISDAKKEFIKSNKLEDIGLDFHQFRNTIASRVIRAGFGEITASRILGNLVKTVRYYYEGNITKSETLNLEVDAAIDLKKDINSIQKMNQVPKYKDKSIIMFAVPGGFCEGGRDSASNCKYYNRLFSNGGCLGCPTMFVSSENNFYYTDLLIRLKKELEKETNEPFIQPIKDKIELVESVLKVIENRGENDGW